MKLNFQQSLSLLMHTHYIIRQFRKLSHYFHFPFFLPCWLSWVELNFPSFAFCCFYKLQKLFQVLSLKQCHSCQIFVFRAFVYEREVGTYINRHRGKGIFSPSFHIVHINHVCLNDKLAKLFNWNRFYSFVLLCFMAF